MVKNSSSSALHAPSATARVYETNACSRQVPPPYFGAADLIEGAENSHGPACIQNRRFDSRPQSGWLGCDIRLDLSGLGVKAPDFQPCADHHCAPRHKCLSWPAWQMAPRSPCGTAPPAPRGLNSPPARAPARSQHTTTQFEHDEMRASDWPFFSDSIHAQALEPVLDGEQLHEAEVK